MYGMMRKEGDWMKDRMSSQHKVNWSGDVFLWHHFGDLFTLSYLGYWGVLLCHSSWQRVKRTKWARGGAFREAGGGGPGECGVL